MVKLLALMGLTSGSADLAVGLIDGPVANDHPDLATGQIRTVGRSQACSPSNSAACVHGTGIAGILFARRCSRCHADSTIVLDGEPCDVPLKRVFAIDLLRGSQPMPALWREASGHCRGPPTDVTDPHVIRHILQHQARQQGPPEGLSLPA